MLMWQFSVCATSGELQRPADCQLRGVSTPNSWSGREKSNPHHQLLADTGDTLEEEEPMNYQSQEHQSFTAKNVHDLFK